MVSNKTSKKAKKPVETTLGKAPSKPKEKVTDVSHLRKPIETNIGSIRQVFSLLDNATSEVKNFLMYECDIIYECRICRSIFRSLANFILHKRNYCREKINPLDFVNNNNAYQENTYTTEEQTESSKDNSKSLSNVIKKLHALDKVKEIAKNVLAKDLASEADSTIVKNMDDRAEKSSNFSELVLEKIDTNASGVFQTILDKSNNECSSEDLDGKKSTKLEVMEIHKILENDVPVIDPDGKISGFTSSNVHQPSIFPKSQFQCIECNHRFSSQKSLNNHIKCVHNPSRIVYVCPTCKDTFANPWCVYRHLLKVHRMTNKQVRRMRDQVHNSWIRRSEESTIQKKKPEPQQPEKADSENQWINDIEGDKDFQMCAGCGKHFERKAALHSHSQMCAKRMEVCNSIKENAKKREEEALEQAKLEKLHSEKPKGASKRKSKTVWSYQRKPKDAVEDGSKEDDLTSAAEKGEYTLPDSQQKDLNDGLLNIVSSNDEASAEIKTNKTYCSISKDEASAELKANKTDCLSSKDEASAELKANKTYCSSSKDEASAELKANKTDCQEHLVVNAASTDETDQEVVVSDVGTSISEYNQNLKMEQTMEDDSQVKNSLNKADKKENEQNEYMESSVSCSKSTKSDKSARTRSEDNYLSQSNCFVITTNSDATIGTETYVKSEILDYNSEKVNEIDGKVHEESDNLVLGITTKDDLEENSSDLNPFFICKQVVTSCLQSNDIQGDNSNNLLDQSQDLLSNDVTFEMFCKKVAKVEKNSKDRCKRSAAVMRKRRKIAVTQQESSKSCLDEDDDVIFVGETIDTHGFAGFPNKDSHSVDLSNLSYNNPLKCKQGDDSSDDLYDISEGIQRRSARRRSRRQSLESQVNIPRQITNDYSLIQRAAPYMNQTKLQCIPCGLTFKSYKLLIWHMSAHFSWFRFQCCKCAFITFNKYDCMLHARKQHKLKENNAANYILPLPNWKTVLMSHEFRLLTDCNDLTGKHTDEKIGIDECHDQDLEDVNEVMESNAMLFGEIVNSFEDSSGVVLGKENVKNKRNKFGKTVIDIQETINDYQRLPEPVELAMPADVGDVIRTLSFDEDVLSPEENTTIFDSLGDESNDDWDLPKKSDISENLPLIKPDLETTSDSEFKKAIKPESVTSNMRSSRKRTKAKQNDDFVYYDNDINNVLKTTDSPKGSPPKRRSENGLSPKSKVSGKMVPSCTLKRKV